MTRPVLVVMGVSGSGKSTVAIPLALDDADRAPWLAAIADWIAARLRAGTGGVVTCSALRRAYRDRLRQAGDRVIFVYLKGSKPLIATRVEGRRGHFMPPALLDSQFATLEAPTPDEHVIVVDIDQPADAQVADILAAVAA
jgi:gluconokinase